MQTEYVESTGRVTPVTPDSPLPIKADLPDTAEAFSGTATETAAEVEFSGASRSLLIENTDSVNDLLVSLDGKASYITIQEGASFGIEIVRDSVWVKANTGLTATYQIINGYKGA